MSVSAEQSEFAARVREISALAATRAAAYPVRDSSYLRLMEASRDFSEYLRRGIRFDEFQPRADILANAAEFSSNPVFICGAMKSGTTLLTWLLDGHPDLLVMPGDSCYADDLGTWERTEFPAISTHWMNRMISPSGKEPFWFLGSDRAALEAFLQYLHYYLKTTSAEVFVCAVLAIYASMSVSAGLTRRRYWVEKTPENELKAAVLRRHFPEARFIHILRDPLENIVSLKRMSAVRKWNTNVNQFACLTQRLFRAARTNQKTFGERTYRLVRYEDLVANPEKELRGMCDFLGIPYHEALLTPTENGRPGIANSMFPERRTQGKIFDPGRRRDYAQHLEPAELRDIVTILYREAVRFGYDWARPEIARHRRSAAGQLFRRVAGRCGVSFSR